MSRYDSWLEQPYQDQYAEEDRIEEEIEFLMDTEHNPHDFDIFMDAIANDALYDKKAEITAALAKDGTMEQLGKAIYQAVWDYCERRATEQATN